MSQPKKKYKIATLGSHSALQILKGAKDEGFETVLIGIKDRLEPYISYKVADKIYEIEKIQDFFDIEEQLIAENCILIIHGSFVEFLGSENMEKIKMLHFGNNNILKWESDRNLEREWLLKANLNCPISLFVSDEFWWIRSCFSFTQFFEILFYWIQIFQWIRFCFLPTYRTNKFFGSIDHLLLGFG